jgi:hypothetical protein
MCTQYNVNTCPTTTSPCQITGDNKCIGINCTDIGCDSGNEYCKIIKSIYNNIL